jgi:hypothetical protein
MSQGRVVSISIATAAAAAMQPVDAAKAVAGKALKATDISAAKELFPRSLVRAAT